MDSAEAYREFYDRLGHDYEETEAVYSTRLGRVRYRAVVSELTPFARCHARLLDIGCNDGVYTIPYCQLGGVAHGLDISAALIEKAKARASEAKLSATFEVGDIEECSLRPEYDVILMSEVLEHFRSPETAVRIAVAGIRPGGYLLLTTPLPYSGFRTFLRNLVARTPLTQPFEFENFGVRYRHDGYYPLALKDWLEGFGLECAKAVTIEREVSLKAPMRLLLGCRNLQLHRKTVGDIPISGGPRTADTVAPGAGSR